MDRKKFDVLILFEAFKKKKENISFNNKLCHFLNILLYNFFLVEVYQTNIAQDDRNFKYMPYLSSTLSFSISQLNSLRITCTLKLSH